MLNKIDGFGRKGRRGVVVGGILDRGTIGWVSPVVGIVLQSLGWRVLELEKSSAKLVGRANVTGAHDVVPGNVETTLEGTDPIDAYTVKFLEGLDEVVGIFFADIFDAKIIHHKGKSDGFGSMIPKGGGVGNRRKAEPRKVRF